MKYDVIIIGAGPGGSEAAFRLASEGYSVLVLEKDRLDREKTCGGGLQGMELEEFGELPNSIIERRITHARLVSHNLNILKVLSDPQGATVKRSKYDRYLQKRAEQKGAIFQEKSKVQKVYLKELPEVICGGECKDRFSAKLLIDASGHHSVVRKSMGIIWKKNQIGATYQYWLRIDKSQIDGQIGDCCEFYFDSTIIPEGYVWIFPKREVVAVGIGSMADVIVKKKINLKNKLNYFIKRHPIASRKLAGGKIVFKQGSIAPLRIAERIVFPSTLVVGDAGGFVNPLHGGGIYPARKSAKIACKYALEYLDTGRQEDLQDYDSEIREFFYEQNYRWDMLMRPLVHDDKLMNGLILRGINGDERILDSFNHLFMSSMPHKEVYKVLKEFGVKLISEIYPISSLEALQDVIFIPRTLNLNQMINSPPDRILCAVSYCAKCLNCPMGRSTLFCNLDCNLCEISTILKKCKSVGVHGKIEKSDDTFLNEMDGTSHKFEMLIAIACPYAANKIGYAVNKIYGIKGIIIPLQGDICTSENKYRSGIQGAKEEQTKTNLKKVLEILDMISSKKKSR